MMSPADLFGLTSSLAAVSWLALILLPRWPLLTGLIRFGVIGLLSLVYAVLVSVWFFRVEGGGFNSIEEVRALFTNDWVLVAGWVHYLAFDLFVGVWVAGWADRQGLSRILQAPLLVAVFMFGPLGLLLAYLVLGSRSTLLQGDLK